MKIEVQHSNSANIYQIEIPLTSDLARLSIGDVFAVYIIDRKGKIKKIEVCLLADKRSFLLDKKIIRFNYSFLALKNEQYRLGLQTNGLVTQNHFIAHIVRPVKTKTIFLNLNSGEVYSPMTGKIISISVEINSKVTKGDTLVIIEAMKMENRITAECSGIISNIKVSVGASIAAGVLLLSIKPYAAEK